MTRLLVALTGSIGSGKSTALDAFKKAGAKTISTDEIAHELTRRGAPAYRMIVKRFGLGVLGQDGGIDRRELAQRVFSSRTERLALEKLLHPRIMSEVRKRAAKSDGVVVVEVPLLFEAALQGEFDVSVDVDAPKAERLRRTLARGLSRAEALKRMAAQLPAEEKAKRADVVLDNSDGRKALEKGVDTLYAAFALIAGTRRKGR